MKGILKVISKNGGIKVKDNDNWINATPQAKIDILARIDEAKKLLLNNEVEILLDDKGLWTGINLVRKIEPELINQPNKEDRKEDNSRLKSMAFSYAKDLCVGNKISVESLIDYAEKIYTYLRS